MRHTYLLVAVVIRTDLLAKWLMQRIQCSDRWRWWHSLWAAFGRWWLLYATFVIDKCGETLRHTAIKRWTAQGFHYRWRRFPKHFQCARCGVTFDSTPTATRMRVFLDVRLFSCVQSPFFYIHNFLLLHYYLFIALLVNEHKHHHHYAKIMWTA